MAVLSINVDDVDQARDLGGRIFYDHWLSPDTSKSSFRYEMTAGRIEALTTAVYSYGCEVRLGISASDMAHSVAVPLDDSLAVRVAGVDYVADSQKALVVRAESDLTAHGWRNGGERLFLMKFEPLALESALSQMIGREVSAPIDFGLKLDLGSQRGAQWWRIANVLASTLTSPDPLVWNPLVSAPLASTLTAGLLLATEHPYRELLEEQHKSAPPPSIKRALSIINERAHEPLTVTGIAAEIGCNVRALQAGFARHVGTSPSQQLTKVRMERVHHELVNGNPYTTSVGEVAGKWGFAHLGRFAGAYRRIYGVAPSKTLRGA